MYARFALALIAAAGLAGVTLPSQAAVTSPGSTAVCFNADHTRQDITNDSQAIIARLAEHGYDASAVEAWGGCIRAYLTDPEGHTSMQLFDPDTMKPVGGSIG